MKRPAEIAMLIKLGSNIDIDEYDMVVHDIIPFLNCNKEQAAESDDNLSISVLTLTEHVAFRFGILQFKYGSILQSDVRSLA